LTLAVLQRIELLRVVVNYGVGGHRSCHGSGPSSERRTIVFVRRLVKIQEFPRKSVCRLVLNSVAQLAVQRGWGCPFAGAAESQDNVHWNCSEPAPRVIQTWVSMLCYRTRYHHKDSSRLISMRANNIRDSSRNQPAAQRLT
jgi:hypothetical protein